MSQLELSLFQIHLVLELPLLDEWRGNARITRRRGKRQLRFGFVEHALQSVGAGELHADVRPRRIEVRRLAEDLEPGVDAPGIEIGGAQTQIHVRALFAGLDHTLELRDGFCRLAEIQERQPEVVVRLR